MVALKSQLSRSGLQVVHNGMEAFAVTSRGLVNSEVIRLTCQTTFHHLCKLVSRFSPWEEKTLINDVDLEVAIS